MITATCPAIETRNGDVSFGVDTEREVSKSQKINYKYAEDRIIADFTAYIDKTYTEHYSADDEISCLDVWLSLGDATPTFRNTALKYIWRYGKKNGNNKADLLKALHYIVFCLYNDHYKE